MTRIRAIQWGVFAAALSFSVTLLAVLALNQGRIATPSVTPDLVPQLADANMRVTNDVRVYNAVKDAVVNITSSRLVTVRVSSGNDVFDRMNPQALPLAQVQAQSLGTGFVIHSSGYIITNEHVVEQATDVQCVFAGGLKLSAKIIATDNDHDLAVLKVDPVSPLHAMTLGTSEDLMIGEPVYAIGNPFGFQGTMTRGIISAVNRTLDLSPTKSYKGLVQTDASINPGNSGGPLINAYGQVIGINTAIRQGATGIGFAISVSNMRDLLPAFLNPEALNHTQVGFTLEEHRTDAPPANVTAAVMVKSVEPDSEAFKSGLRTGDQILSIGGTPADNIVNALVAMGSAKADQVMPLVVTRGDGTKVPLGIPVAKIPAPPSPEEIILARMGFKAQTINLELAQRKSLVIDRGIFVDFVQEDSPAKKIGIQPGDVILQLGPHRVGSIEDVAFLLKANKDPVKASIWILRGNQIGSGTISLN